MHKHSRVVTSTSCPAMVTQPVTVTCPTFTTRTMQAVPIAEAPVTVATTTPTMAAPSTTTTDLLTSLLGQLGAMGAVTPTVTPTAALPATALNPTQQVFTNPVAQLGALNPLAALAAADPVAALSGKSPVLGIFNPALNPNAAFLQFNPAAAPTLALGGVAGPATLPFGKFGRKFPTGI